MLVARHERNPHGSERLRPDRHSCHAVAVDEEAEVAWAVEPFASDVRRYYGRLAVLFDDADCQADVGADEPPVPPSSDGGLSDELPAPIVDDAAIDERPEERFGVVGVRRL